MYKAKKCDLSGLTSRKTINFEIEDPGLLASPLVDTYPIILSEELSSAAAPRQEHKAQRTQPKAQKKSFHSSFTPHAAPLTPIESPCPLSPARLAESSGRSASLLSN